MCRCTVCEFPIYVTINSVTPPVHPEDKKEFHHYDAASIPFKWEKGDLLMELYDVRDELGRGGMGVVHRVHHRGWGIDVAVKSPKERLVEERGWVATFEHECETWVNLPPHPNTVICYCVRRLGDIPRVFVEYVDGPDLGNMIRDKSLYRGSLEEKLHRMFDIIIQVCKGLNHAHVNGVVHQDVKPKNILVAKTGEVKVTDFGLARVGVAERDPGSSSPGKLIRWGPLGGTPVYSSPDYKRLNEVTAQSDVWSLGLAILEMFSGEVFWHDGQEARSTMKTLLQYGARYPEVPRIPKSLVPVLEQCFEVEPSARPDGMLGLARLIEEVYRKEIGRVYHRSSHDLEVHSFDLMNNRAVSLADLGQAYEAEALWTEIRGADPNHIEARYNLALHQWRVGKISDNEVVAKLYRLCALHEGHWMPPYLLARVLVERGDAAAACTVLDNLSPADKRSREVAFGIAVSHERMPKDKKKIWELLAHSTALTAVHLSNDGSHFLSGCLAGRIRYWERHEHRLLRTLEGHTGAVNAFAVRRAETIAFSAGADGTIRQWDLARGEGLRVLEGHEGPVLSLDLCDEMRVLISGGQDGTVRHWDLATGACVHTWHTQDSPVFSLAVSSNGAYAISGHESGNLAVWDIRDGRLLKRYTQNKGPVVSMAVSHTRPYVVTTSGRNIRVWNLGRGEIIHTLRGHKTDVHGVCIDQMNRYILSASAQGTLKMWDMKTGQCIRSLQGTAPVSLSQDGRYCLTGDEAGVLKCWQVHLDEAPLIAPFVICRDFMKRSEIPEVEV
ncbi:MAG: serine/threonine protein kinase [Candidatus Hydrogenedentes bacterium]|nr:serine/threonine protein kinase [Candidatus Hydrogenedentota bacterium]